MRRSEEQQRSRTANAVSRKGQQYRTHRMMYHITRIRAITSMAPLDSTSIHDDSPIGCTVGPYRSTLGCISIRPLPSPSNHNTIRSISHHLVHHLHHNGRQLGHPRHRNLRTNLPRQPLHHNRPQQSPTPNSLRCLRSRCITRHRRRHSALLRPRRLHRPGSGLPPNLRPRRNST